MSENFLHKPSDSALPLAETMKTREAVQEDLVRVFSRPNNNDTNLLFDPAVLQLDAQKIVLQGIEEATRTTHRREALYDAAQKRREFLASGINRAERRKKAALARRAKVFNPKR